MKLFQNKIYHNPTHRPPAPAAQYEQGPARESFAKSPARARLPALAIKSRRPVLKNSNIARCTARRAARSNAAGEEL